MECISSTTPDSMPKMDMINQSRVDVFLSGLADIKTAKVIVAMSGDLTIYFQSDAGVVEEEQMVINEEDDQETNGQHPVSSKQQVDEKLIVSLELDDTAALNNDDNDVTTIIQSIVDELFTKHS